MRLVLLAAISHGQCCVCALHCVPCTFPRSRQSVFPCLFVILFVSGHHKLLTGKSGTGKQKLFPFLVVAVYRGKENEGLLAGQGRVNTM